jgi:hypothetical protein
MTFKNLSGKARWAVFAGVLFVSSFGLLLSQADEVKAEKNPKPEDVVERTILAYGSRAALYAVQRNGTLRALVKFVSPEGTREGKSVTKFIRKEKLKDDLRIIELDFPGTRYMLGFDGKDIWSILDGEVQKPGEDVIKAFRSGHEHSYESLLRYKENNSKIEYVGNTKLLNLEIDIIDLISPEGVRTRYEVSRKSGRILYLNYEEKPNEKAEPIKYRLNFKDFRVIQNTLIPYETLVFQDGKLVEERKIVEAVFNVQLKEEAFKAENANKPADAAAKQ